MDSSMWQFKCSSTLQSSVMASASSSSQEPRNQMECNASHCFHPYFGQDLRSHAPGRMSDPMFSNIPNLRSHGVDLSKPENSFLALLSGPASFLQCDFQELSNDPKLFNASNKLPAEGSIMALGASRSSVSVSPTCILAENLSCHNQRNGTELCPVISKTMNGSNSCNSSLQHSFQATNFNHRCSDKVKTVIHPTVFGNQKVISSLRGERHNAVSANTSKLQNINNQLPQKMPLEAGCSNSKNFAFSNECPRVFCMGCSGDLLLSNTGLLGILCSCHCFHMSVSKFCEHSGLIYANVGDAVHMESGETIAQWRKLYFQRFGIRVPEDQSGWDWPEGLSLTSSLVKSGAPVPFFVSNMSKNSDSNHMVVGPCGGSEGSGKPLPKNCLADQHFIDASCNKQKIVQDDENILFKGLFGTLQSNSCGVESNHLLDCHISRCSTMPKSVFKGPDDGCQSVCKCNDAIAKTGSLSMAHPSRPTLRTTFVKSSEVSKANDGGNSASFDKDATSNIELKLGQPYQQSRSPGNPVILSMRPWAQNTFVNLQKPFSQEQMSHNVTISEGEEARKYIHHATGLSNPTTRKEQQCLNYRNCVIDNSRVAGKQEKVDMVMTPVVPIFKHFSTPPAGSSHFNDANIGEHITPETLYCESPIIKGSPVTFPWNGGNFLERHPELSFFNPIDRDKEVGFFLGNHYTETVLSSKMPKQMENHSSFVEVVGQNRYSEFPATYIKNGYPLRLSSLQGVSDTGNFSNYGEKASCFGNSGHTDDVVVKTRELTMRSSPILPSQAVTVGLSSSPSTFIPDLTPSFKQETTVLNPYLLDDNLRLLALRQILELSKQQHDISAHGKILEQGSCGNTSIAEVGCSHVEPLKCGEQRLEPDHVSCKQDINDISNVLVRSCPFHSKTGNGADAFTSVTGPNNWCDFSLLAQGVSLDCNRKELQCQLSFNSSGNEQPSLRLGREGNIISSSNKHENCCQRTFYIQGKCNCVVDTKGLGEKCKLRSDSPPNPFTEKIGSVNGKPPSIVASHLAKDYALSKEATVLSDNHEKNSDPANLSCHTSQWKDVPNKVNRVCEEGCADQSAIFMDGKRHLIQLGDTDAMCSNASVQIEQEMSNISSGCSAPVVTQTSIEVNKMETSNVVDGNTGYVENLVDEGSSIIKCWSSDTCLESDRSTYFYNSVHKRSPRKERSFNFNNQRSRSLLDEVKLINSLTWKKGQNQIHNDIFVRGKANFLQEPKRGLKIRKRKRELQSKLLDASLSSEISVARGKHSGCGETAGLACSSKDQPSSKQRKSTISLVKTFSHKRDVHMLYHERGEDHKTDTNDVATSYKILDISNRKKSRSTGISDGFTQFPGRKTQTIGEASRFDLMIHRKASASQKVNACHRKARPVVCGKYGEIINGNMIGDVLKPTKFGSLDRILKIAKRCTILENIKPRLNFGLKNVCSDKFCNMKIEEGNRCNDASFVDGLNLHTFEGEKKNGPGGKDRQSGHEFSVLVKQRENICGKDCNKVDCARAQSKPKCKEIRKRSLYELTMKGKNSTSDLLLHKNISECTPETKVGKNLKNCESEHQIHVSRQVNNQRCIEEQKILSIMESDSFCCVCGSSKKDEDNCLLECGQCLIKVHQACYGISRVPKGHWYCRPCRTSSKDIACVLCGYGGGAMTRALRSWTIVKSLLKFWSLKEEDLREKRISSAETLNDNLSFLHSSGSVKNNLYPFLGSVDVLSTSGVWNTDMQNPMSSGYSFKVHNSITAGVLDTTVKQWVHMVCSLWTPGTRCPNVETMSAFDVSGAFRPRSNVVCSVCNRPGGTCIRCRVVNCYVQFHPWCAHQKGLLQSEIEGDDNENVGFYGRCMRHASYQTNESAHYAANTETFCLGEKEVSCARTEGYKGRKRDGFWHHVNDQSNGKSGCLVPQEQLDAWIHINGQKSCIQGLLKQPMSVIEYDCRKEYAHYKQCKSWRHFVVYKSGIHALGLYTSRFISRGEMVVEYVGEIVGLRVADKRENDYQSGRKLQYKSACYFFRIDKEHIIDATRKGGIARFVNHSCSPNCVAKVISVKNEKKVVFFAERDINPGEEITYDYHFNHEDEGKKIPCFCNSKNCRRYLN